MTRPLTKKEKENLKEFDSYALLDSAETLEHISNLTGDEGVGELPTLRDQILALHEHLFKITVEGEDYFSHAESISVLMQKVCMSVADLYMDVERVRATLSLLEDILPKENNPHIDTKRLTLEVPSELHTRFKTACSATGKKMASEIEPFLKKRTEELEKIVGLSGIYTKM